MQLKSAEKIFVILFHAIQQKFCSSPVPDAHLNSFHSSFAEVLLHLHVDLHVASIATERAVHTDAEDVSLHVIKWRLANSLTWYIGPATPDVYHALCGPSLLPPSQAVRIKLKLFRNQLNFMNLKYKIWNYNIKQVKSIKAWHLVPQIHFGEAECLKMSVGGSDRGCNRLHQKLL